MSKQKILIVDDEVILTKMLKLNFDEDDIYHTETLNDGKKAIDYIKEYMPDLVLLDVMMPGIQGSEIADAILNDNKLKHIKIIFLTAIVTKNEVPGVSKTIGGRKFIAKPVKADELIAAIKAELE
ncbi:MAG: CheY-like chemotaxis protein [Gammaproteobacteria bacterium]|jgi:CheY-like chemotaxis protein